MADDHEHSKGDDAGRSLDLNKAEHKEKLHAIFKNAHMEIASHIADRNEGLGHDGTEWAKLWQAINNDLDEQGAESQRRASETGHKSVMEMMHLPHFLASKQQTEDGLPLGIIEDPVEQKHGDDIKDFLEKALEKEEHHAEEIWLDCLLTILEDVGAVQFLQDFYSEGPFIQPKTSKEINDIQQTKLFKEKRLNGFLVYIHALARKHHYFQLQKSAKIKQKHLKSQSLVLSDYLTQLDDQIEKLKTDIEDLNQKNLRVRKHVQPLL